MSRAKAGALDIGRRAIGQILSGFPIDNLYVNDSAGAENDSFTYKLSIGKPERMIPRIK